MEPFLFVSPVKNLRYPNAFDSGTVPLSHTNSTGLMNSTFDVTHPTLKLSQTTPAFHTA